jgi:methionine biosynthesis protein MetW
VHGTFRRWEAHRTDVVSGLLRPGAALLDVGCGDGDLLKRNMRRFQRLHGVDIAMNRVSRAAAGGSRDILVQVADIDAGLPYDDGRFDAVTCVAVLEHVFDPAALVRELARVLKCEGQLVVEVPNIAFLPRRIGLLLGRLPRTAYNEPGWDGSHLHYFTFDALEKQLAQNGVQVTHRLCAGIAHRLRSVRPQLLGADIILVGRKRRQR